MRVLDRYGLKEFAGPFAACVAGFTVMLLAGIIFELTDLIVDQQMPPDVVLQLLLYKLPMVIGMTLPVAVLFAILLALGRWAKDTELTVMRATGCAFFRLVLPLIVAAALVSAVGYALNEVVVPAANHRAEDLYRQAMFRDAVPQIDAGVFLHGPQGRTFYVGEVNRQTRELHHIMIFEDIAGSGGSPYPALLTARTGTYREGMWLLHDGVRRVFDADGYVVQEVAFATLDVPMVQGEEQLFGEQKTVDEMTRRELAELIKLYRQSGHDMSAFLVEYHLKMAGPLAALVWALIAAPLAVAARRSGRAYGVVASIAVAFIYYVALAVGRSFGSNGVIDPALAAWLPTVVFATAGLVALARADQV